MQCACGFMCACNFSVALEYEQPTMYELLCLHHRAPGPCPVGRWQGMEGGMLRRRTCMGACNHGGWLPHTAGRAHGSRPQRPTAVGLDACKASANQ